MAESIHVNNDIKYNLRAATCCFSVSVLAYRIVAFFFELVEVYLNDWCEFSSLIQITLLDWKYLLLPLMSVLCIIWLYKKAEAYFMKKRINLLTVLLFLCVAFFPVSYVKRYKIDFLDQEAEAPKYKQEFECYLLPKSNKRAEMRSEY